MDLLEIPLLHYPDLMLALLKESSQREARIEDAAARLGRDLRAAHEVPGPLGEALEQELATARDALLAAHFIEALSDDRFRITPRGREALRRHPHGIDDSVLMDYAEFRDWLGRAAAAQAPPEDARSREFQRGWAAQQDGRDLTENPFAPDTAQHAAWEDGWLAARRQ